MIVQREIRKRGAVLVAALLSLAGAAAADTIGAGEILAGIDKRKTDLARERWWKTNMAGKTHAITGRVKDVREGALSGFWVEMDIGGSVTLRCGLDDAAADTAMDIAKGEIVTCQGEVGPTWTEIFGVTFSIDEAESVGRQ